MNCPYCGAEMTDRGWCRSCTCSNEPAITTGNTNDPLPLPRQPQAGPAVEGVGVTAPPECWEEN